MTIINTNYIYINGKFQENLAVAFDNKIKAIDTIENLKKLYPQAIIEDTKENSVLYPGFINTHVHLEFSANKTTLKYGSFMPWLESVIQNREELVGACSNDLMMQECQNMMKSGITTFGAISSFGLELEVCTQTPQKVIFFNEIIGSNASIADMLYNNFLERLDESKKYSDKGITPAVAIHSPYSVHPIVLKRAVNVAKTEKLPLTAHFLESQAERKWLEDDSGEFLPFFQKYFNSSKSITKIDEFLKSFDELPTHFVHVVQANSEELKYLAQKGHSIAHCPRSNRLLGCGRLPIETLIELKIPFTIATDGLSSNNSLNIFDELRAGVMLHHLGSLEKLALLFIASITSIPAKIFSLNSGKIELGRDADFALVTLPAKPLSLESIALQTILHTKEVTNVWISGKKEI